MGVTTPHRRRFLPPPPWFRHSLSPWVGFTSPQLLGRLFNTASLELAFQISSLFNCASETASHSQIMDPHTSAGPLDAEQSHGKRRQPPPSSSQRPLLSTVSSSSSGNLPSSLSHLPLHLSKSAEGKVGCNFGRQHPEHQPTDADAPGHDQWRQKRDQALLIAANGLEEQRRRFCLFDCIVFEKLRLTFNAKSQSKLSTQDLSELQKATKFDKKELQQWYKGNFNSVKCACAVF